MVGSIRSRFFAVGAFFILWMGIAVAFSMTQIAAVTSDLATLSRFVEPVKDGLHGIQSRQLELGTLLTRYLRMAQSDNEADRAQLSGIRIEIKAKQETILSQLNTAKTVSATGLADRGADVSRDMLESMLSELRILENKFRSLSGTVTTLTGAVEVDDMEAARRAELSARGQQRALTSQLRASIDRLAAHVELVVANVTDRERMLVQVEVVLLTLAALFGLVLAGWFARVTVLATRELSSGVQAIADGDLDVQIHDVQGDDELARLGRSFNRMVREIRFNRRVVERFGKQMDPKVVRNLIKEETALEASERRVMTVVICNLTGFDRLAEQWEPERLKEFMIDYLNAMCDPVSQQKGIVDGFVSDQVVSFWGPPFCSAENHAKRACTAALDQMARFEHLVAKYAEHMDEHALSLRIGITTGEVVVGSIGTNKSQFYTVVGNSLNYANRLEKANRIYDTEILVSRETVEMLGDDFVVRDLDKVVLLGTDRPSHFYQLLGKTGHVPDHIHARVTVFEQALAHYRHGEFEAAIPLFEQVLEEEPSDFAPQLFLNRMERLSRREQTRAWDGVWVVRDPYERVEADG